MNSVDTKQRAPSSKVEMQPRVLGWDAAGTVAAVGSEVTLFKPGDQVYYAGDITRAGTRGTIAMKLRVDVDNCAAADFPIEHPAHHCGNLCEADHLRHAGELAQVQITRQWRPGLDAGLLRGIHRVDTGKGHVAQDEGQDRCRKIHALSKAAGRDHAAILCLRQYVRQRVTADGVRCASHLSLAIGGDCLGPLRVGTIRRSRNRCHRRCCLLRALRGGDIGTHAAIALEAPARFKHWLPAYR